MSALFVIARLIHITTAIFWGGALLFVNIVLAPAMTALGPDGSKVMQELVRRGYFEKIFGAGILTIATGLYMIWVDSAGFNGAWFGTHFGQAISTGMLAAIIGFLMGVFLIRPGVYRMLAVGGEMARATEADRPALLEKLAAERARFMPMAATATLLLVVAMVSMALARSI